MNKSTKAEKSNCGCAFCEDELKQSCFEPVFCEPCGVELVACKKCGKKFGSKVAACPSCGEKHARK